MKLGRRVASACARILGVLVVASCSLIPSYTAPATMSDLPSGASVGEACSGGTPCRPGLACTTGVCQPGHSSSSGTACVICSECVQGDYCGPDRTCATAGTGASGDPCKSDGDCSAGLRCSLVGLNAECAPQGMSDVGGTCTTSSDCFCGLACASGMCAPLPPNPTGVAPLAIPTWTGATCTDDPAPTKAYFRVPRGVPADGDFYRLPFPNDVRLKNGHPDMSNHPTPGPELLGFDVVARYLTYVEQATDGFSTYPTVIFRFNAAYDFDSVGKTGALRYVDVTPGASGGDLGFAFEVTNGRGAYLCSNAISIRPPRGAPLTPGHTYAVLVGNVILDSNKVPVVASSDFTAMLGAAPPSDPTLTTAYAAYKPLRDWATAKKVSLSTFIDGTVFTVAHATDEGAKLAAAALAAPAPTAKGWIKCGGTAPDPCPQATADRACPATPDPSFDELHALITLPIFQKGTEPYLTPTDGGDLVLGAGGVPVVQRTEEVCMSLTIPKETMPSAGWPLVVFAHGTGGSYRSHIASGTPSTLLSVANAAGTKVSMAMLGIDQVEHGTRRGASQESPDDLFFNFANPAAARGNPLQGSADQVGLLRFAQTFDLPAASSPIGAEIKFGSIAYWGHSQGSTEGGISLGYVSGYAGVVFSGQGASLIDALVTKTNPVDIKDAVPFVLEETATVDTFHPVLSILQNAIDPDDPLNYAANFVASQPAMVTPKHLFQPYGQDDTYAPPVTQETFALAARLGLAAPDSSVTTPDPIGSLKPLPVPVSGNLTLDGMPFTAVLREYKPSSSYDGHFVAFDNPDGVKDVANYLADTVTGLVPQVGR